MKQLLLISVACCLAATQLPAQNRISREGSPETIVRVAEFDSLMHAKSGEYCPSYSGNDEYEHIANVSFAGINNNSGGSFYSDFTDIYATVEAGNVYALAVTVSNENGEDDYDERVLVWIDWNQNHVFDPDELYDFGVKNVAMGSTEVFTKTIHVPADATPGDTRMRVSLKYYEPAEYDEDYPGEEWWGYSEDFYLDPCATYDPDFEPDLSYEGGMDNFDYGEVEDYSVTVVETTSTYEITATASPEEGGSVSGAGTYAHGAEVTLTATPAANYDFDSWTENGTEVSAQPEYTFTAEEDRDLVAHFTHLGYILSLSVQPEGAGHVEADPQQDRYHQGEEITLTATPAAGSQFLHWEDATEAILSEETSFVFTMPAQDTSLVAVFEALTYQITATASPEEGGSVSGAGTYAHGAEVTLTATPAANYAFDSWTENGTEVSAQPEYTFTAEEDRDLVANFTHLTYKLTFRVEDTEGEEIADAIITLNDHTHDEGHYEFPGLVSGTYHYAVSRESYESKEGTITIKDTDVEETVILEIVTSTVDPGSYNIKVFPNPADSHLRVEANTTIEEIRMLDILGQVVYSSAVGNNRYEISLEGLKKGIYFLQVTTAHGVSTERVQVTR